MVTKSFRPDGASTQLDVCSSARALRRFSLRDAVAIVEFVPNPERIACPPSAGFSLVMLATNPGTPIRLPN
jgi:hypothetical protein